LNCIQIKEERATKQEEENKNKRKRKKKYEKRNGKVPTMLSSPCR